MDKVIFDWDLIEVKGSHTGKKKTNCPICAPTRKKSTTLSVDFDKGLANCHRVTCQAASYREKSQDFKPKNKTYKLPKQDWKNYTKLSDNLVKWFEKDRKIMQSTLIDLKVTEENYMGQNCVVFNYFEGETVVNKKYRTGKKRFYQTAGTKNVFYNLQAAVGKKEVYIVEGEMDVLTMHDAGYKNVISAPNGTSDTDDVWLNAKDVLKDIESFIIAVDSDEAGLILREKVAQRLGRWRCKFIEWESAKDANDCYKLGTLEEELQNIQFFKVSGTYTAEDLEPEIFELYNNGKPSRLEIKAECFKDSEGNSFNDIFTTHQGHLVTITGIPSHGKTAFSEWYGLNLAYENNMKLSFFSPEHDSLQSHHSKLAAQAVGKSFYRVEGAPRMNPADLKRYINWANERIYLTSPEKGKTPDWDWLFEKFTEQIYGFGINIFYVDAFNKVRLPNGNKKDQIDGILTELTNFVKLHNVIIFLVAHPTKMQDKNGESRPPNLYDVSGSSDFRNQTHDGYCVYRNFEKGTTSFINLKVKNGYQGKMLGTFEFRYDVPTGRYYAGSHVPTFDMTLSQEDVVQTNFSEGLKPNRGFEFEMDGDPPPF